MTAVFRRSISIAKGVVALLAVLASVTLANSVAYPWIEEKLVLREQDRSRSTLRLASGVVDQAIDRFKPLPGLIATDPVFRELLDDPGNQGIVPFVNEKLRHLRDSVEATEIYVMDANGTTLASSNYREPGTFVGSNFSYRPYFQRALGGETTQFHALGTTSGERGFFFASPILDGIQVAGVLAIKVNADTLEASWEGTSQDVLLADPNGVVFLSNRPSYRLRSLAPLSDGVLAQIEATRQFPLDAVQPIPFSASVISEQAVEFVLGAAGEEESFLANSQPLTLPGWHSVVLSPLRPIRQQSAYYLAVGNLAAAALALAALLLIQGRARILERRRVEQNQRDLLEGRVRDRTADLDAANKKLRAEVNERKAAEDRLRQTQKELVQAGKLAALGQMSAAISHEINQPLAAVKSYADNAALYLKRDRTEEAGANIERISQMADRMARISGHLRNFARRPGDALKDVPLGEVVEEALALMEPQLRRSECEVDVDGPEADVWVRGGRLRLQQVLINIMTNALDAMEGVPGKRIEISIARASETATLSVRDHGPGLAPEALESAFDAFFSTKEAGSGMGLGLSIAFNIIEDFGGHLRAANHPEGGGIFEVELRLAERSDGRMQTMVAE